MLAPRFHNNTHKANPLHGHLPPSPSPCHLLFIPVLGDTGSYFSLFSQDRGMGSLGALPVPTCPCRSYLGTWSRPPVRHSRPGRYTRRSLRCCGSGRHRAGGSGSTHLCLGRPVEGPTGEGLSAGPPPPPTDPHPLPRHTAQVLGRQAHTLTGHHGAGLEAICTGTFEASNDVGARAFPTGEPNGALVCVWGVVDAFREPPILDIILSASPLTATNWIGPGLVWL